MSEGLEGCRMLMEHPEQLPQDSCQQGVFMEVGGGVASKNSRLVAM